MVILFIELVSLFKITSLVEIPSQRARGYEHVCSKDAREMCLRSSDFMACLLFTVMKTIDGPQWVQRDPMFGGRGIWLADAKHYDVLNAFDHQFGMFNDQVGASVGCVLHQELKH